MKDRPSYVWLLFASCLAFSALTAFGAPPLDAAAKAHAAAYQARARTVLVARGWTIHREQPGKLVAEHYAGINPGFGGAMEVGLVSQNASVTGVAQATIIFVPKSAADTFCKARMVLYGYGQRRGAGGQYPLTGPYPFGNHRAVEELQKALEKARAQS